jgi:hypothetical protein
MNHHQSPWKDHEQEKMLEFLSVGLAAASNPNNDPGEAQIAVLPKTKLYFKQPTSQIPVAPISEAKVLRQMICH